MFQKFSQADSSDSRRLAGTGLGLAISRAIVERLGGHIGFDTGPGGTTFFFELPDAEQHRGRQPSALSSVEGFMNLSSFHRFPIRGSDFVAMLLIALGAVVIGDGCSDRRSTVIVGLDRVGMTFNPPSASSSPAWR